MHFIINFSAEEIMSSLIGAFAKNERLSLSKHSAIRRAFLFVPTLLVVSVPIHDLLDQVDSGVIDILKAMHALSG